MVNNFFFIKVKNFLDLLTNQKKIRRKVIISISSGVLCFLLSPYSISLELGNTVIKIAFSLLFPIVVSLAYGWRYGFLAAISFGAFFPFYLQAGNGWANFFTTALYFLFFTTIGLTGDEKNKDNSDQYFRLGFIMFLFFLLLFILHSFLYNPLISLKSNHFINHAVDSFNRNLTLIFAIKDSINLLILVIFSDLILQLPFFRVLLHLSVDKEMRFNTRIFLSTFFVCAIFWISYLGLSFVLLNHDGFIDGHIQLVLLIILTGGGIVARIIIFFFEKQILAKDALVKSEKSLQLQFNLMPVACIIWDRNQRIRSWNPAAEKIFGFKSEEVVGKNANETIVPIDLQDQMVNVWDNLFIDGLENISLNRNINENGQARA